MGRDRALLLGTTIAVAAIYLPMAWYRFGSADDYRQSLDSTESVTSFWASMGRPLAGVLMALGFAATPHISGFAVLRAVSIALLAAQAGLLAVLLKRRGVAAPAAVAISVAAFTTAGVQVATTWVVLLPAPPASLLAGLGALAIWSSWRRSRVRSAAGALAVVCGLATYQPSGMAAIGVVLVLLATGHAAGDCQRGRIAHTAVWIGAALVAYLLIWKACQSIWPLDDARGEMASDPNAKLDWLVHVVVQRVLHPWSPWPHGKVFAVVVAALAVLAPVTKGRPPVETVALMAAMPVGLLLMLVPNLATAESFASSRSLWTALATVVVLAGIGVTRATAVLPVARVPVPLEPARWIVAGAACAFLGTLACHRTVVYFADPLATELRLEEAAIQRAADTRPRQIALVRAPWGTSLAPATSYDEFGLAAATQPWAPGAVAEPVLDALGFAGEVVVVESATDPAVDPGAAVIVLDDVLAVADSRSP